MDQELPASMQGTAEEAPAEEAEVPKTVTSSDVGEQTETKASLAEKGEDADDESDDESDESDEPEA